MIKKRNEDAGKRIIIVVWILVILSLALLMLGGLRFLPEQRFDPEKEVCLKNNSHACLKWRQKTPCELGDPEYEYITGCPDYVNAPLICHGTRVYVTQL